MMNKSLSEHTNFCTRDVALNDKHSCQFCGHLNSTFRN